MRRCSADNMKEESKSEQKTLSLSGETEVIEFIRSQGFDTSVFYLDHMARWEKSKTRLTRWSSRDDYLNDPMYREFRLREEVILKYGFALLDRRAIEAMRPYAPLLEIGAGSGYWTYELRKYGVDCIATDPMWGRYGFFHGKYQGKHRRWDHHYTNIETLEAVDALRRYPNRNLLIVWPDYHQSWAAEALETFTGQVVIYMGEGYGNATADDRFHELLDERFGDQWYIKMPHFEHSYDRQLLICKKPKQLTTGKTTT